MRWPCEEGVARGGSRCCPAPQAQGLWRWCALSGCQQAALCLPLRCFSEAGWALVAACVLSATLARAQGGGQQRCLVGQVLGQTKRGRDVRRLTRVG